MSAITNQSKELKKVNEATNTGEIQNSEGNLKNNDKRYKKESNQKIIIAYQIDTPKSNRRNKENEVISKNNKMKSEYVQVEIVDPDEKLESYIF